MSQKLFAFWRYSGGFTGFPYMLGAEVVKIHKDGHVTAKGFEGYATFEPLVLLPAEQGAEIKEKLEKLRVEHDEALKKFNEEWKRKVAALLPDDQLLYKKDR